MVKEELKKIIIDELINTVAQTKRCNPLIEGYKTGRFTTSIYSFDDIADNIIAKIIDKELKIDMLKDFLKSKQSIELVAEGEVGIQGYDISIFDDKNIQYIDDIETWEKYQGKQIKLYIEVSK